MRHGFVPPSQGSILFVQPTQGFTLGYYISHLRRSKAAFGLKPGVRGLAPFAALLYPAFMEQEPQQQLPPKQTLRLIVLPLLGTFASLRLYLHLVGVRHVYPGGYLVHHLFTGILILIPAAFLLAFGTRRRAVAVWARVAVGVGSGMILDEITYLVMTKASDDDYVSRTSFVGGAGFVALAVVVLWWLYKAQRE